MNGGRPRPPWHPFPLTELVVLAATACALAATLTFGSHRSFWLGGAALALGVLAGLERAVREHAAHWRPHSGSLAGAAGCVCTAAAVALHASPGLVLVAGGAVFAVLFVLLEWGYRRAATRYEAGLRNGSNRAS
jgi:hypothetical protein